jgi:glycosyltransferase involved in cell wall biosynthesis
MRRGIPCGPDPASVPRKGNPRKPTGARSILGRLTGPDAAAGPVLQVLQPVDGGVARHVLDLTLGLRERGFALEVAAPPECVVLPELDGEGVAVHRVAMERAPGAGDAKALRELRALDRRAGYGIVHAHSSKAGALVRVGVAGRARAVYTPHCLPFASGRFDPATTLAYRLTEMALARRSAAIVAVSEWEGRFARETLGARAPVEVIPNGGRPCGQAEADSRLVEFAGGAPLAGFVSVLRPEKGALALVRAAAALRERGDLPGRVAIVGEGIEVEAVRAEIDALGVADSVRWFSWGGDSTPCFRAIDLLVVPSKWESLPIGPIDAMFCGVPVLATAVGGMTELVSDGVNGRLVAPDAEGALATGLAELLSSPERLKELGAAARAEAEARLGVEPMLERTAALYGRVLGASAPVRRRRRRA